MKKIAIFQSDLNIGGIQKSCVNMLNNIDITKYQVDLYLVEKENIFLKDLKEGININYISKMPYLFKLIPFQFLKVFYAPKISKTYDIVIDFNSYSNETAIAAIKTQAKKKVMWIHNDVEVKIREELLYRILHFLFKSKYQYFTDFVGVSTGALDSFVKVNKIKDKNLNLIPNLVDTSEIKKKLQEKTEIKVDKKKINICSTGRLVHQKGFDLIIEEVRKNREKLKAYHFYFIGGGKAEKKLKKMIAKYNLNDYITLTGFLSNPYSTMKEMDAFLLLSRYEGQGMVFLEAKAIGLEVIMPKHLEKYVDGEIKGSDSIITSILNCKKKNIKFDDLQEYNRKIIDKINNL